MPEITCPCGLPRPHPADGSRCWHPRYLADATDPRFTDGQRAHLARFEAAEVPAEVVEARDDRLWKLAYVQLHRAGHR